MSCTASAVRPISSSSSRNRAASRRLPDPHPALRKLPAAPASAPAEKNLRALHQHDAHVGAKAIRVDVVTHAHFGVCHKAPPPRGWPFVRNSMTLTTCSPPPLASRSPLVSLAGLAVLAILVFVAALLIGSSGIAVNKALAALAGSGDEATRNVLLAVRLPRVLAAFGVGGLLALAGVLLQALFRNPLADPYVLGVSGGAAVGACSP